MKWVQERDLLVAQTLTFVQSITGTRPEAQTRAEPRIGSAPVGEIGSSERTLVRQTASATYPMAESPGGLREEIRRRVAAFRAHQQLFDRERDAYCDAVVTRLRASLANRPISTSAENRGSGQDV
jgi:hypothetical protein